MKNDSIFQEEYNEQKKKKIVKSNVISSAWIELSFNSYVHNTKKC